jgi:hypothetical protein
MQERSPESSRNDREMHIAGEDAVLLITVINETNASIVLSNTSEVVRSYQREPISTEEIRPGVSVKIPIIIPRISCFHKNGKVADFSNKMISLTALKWESVLGSSKAANIAIYQEKRKGVIQIPRQCLKNILTNHDSFGRRVCKPPLRIDFKVNDKSPEKAYQSVQVGLPVNLTINAIPQGTCCTKE